MGSAERGFGDRAVLPAVEGGTTARGMMTLRAAFARAERQLRENPTCRSLFHAFDTDGLSKLRSGLYHWAEKTGRGAIETCRERHAAAFTTVGSGRTCLCPGFDALSIGDAAVILVHEALHYAGMTEWPEDPAGPTSNQINQQVRASCSL